MIRTFIVNGQRMDLEVQYMRFEAKLEDVTPVGTFWREVVNAGDNKIELKGTDAAGRQVSGTFRIVSQPEGNVLEIEPWTDYPTVGGKT